MSIARWTNGILAVWLAFSAFLGFTVAGNVLNLVTVGIFVAGAGIALIQYSRWQGWTSTVAGLWLIAAVFVPGLREGPGLIWNSLIVAAAVLAASLPFPADDKASSRRVFRPRPEPAEEPKEKPSVTVEGLWHEAQHDHDEQELVHH